MRPGRIAGGLPGRLGVDMSTTGPQAARELAAAAARHGADFLDAVSGSTVLAEQGTLTTMAGGPAGAFERVRPDGRCSPPDSSTSARARARP